MNECPSHTGLHDTDTTKHQFIKSLPSDLVLIFTQLGGRGLYITVLGGRSSTVIKIFITWLPFLLVNAFVQAKDTFLSIISVIQSLSSDFPSTAPFLQGLTFSLFRDDLVKKQQKPGDRRLS